MSAARRFGKRVASVPEAGRGMAALSARQWLRRNSRGRDGVGEDVAGIGVFALSATCPRHPAGPRRGTRQDAGGTFTRHLPHVARVQLDRGGEEVYAAVEGARA